MLNSFKWFAKAGKRYDKQPVAKNGNKDEASDIYSRATSWLGSRDLNASYLLSSPELDIYCSENEMINLIWDDQRQRLHNLPVWSLKRGHFYLTKEEFITEVQSFNDRFIQQLV